MSTPITELLAYQIAARHAPGALAHVERAGKVLARHAAGSIQPDAARPMHDGVRFRIASLTKAMVSLVVLMLVDEGRLDLDAPMGELLPALRDMRLANGDKPQAAPTVRDLLRHTSGLAYPHEIGITTVRQAWADAGFTPALTGLDRAAFLARLATLPLVAEPASRFRYGYSTDVLGCIIELLDGCTLAESLKRRLFDPLGMARTGFDLAPDEGPDLATAWADDAAWQASIPAIGAPAAPDAPRMHSGGGGLISTLDDTAAFARLLAQGGEVGGRRLLSARLMAEFGRNQLPEGVDGPASYTGPGFGFGLGLAVRHDWGPSAMPCCAGEMCWSGISGTALFVQPREQWFALLFSANTASRMMTRLAFRRAASQL